MGAPQYVRLPPSTAVRIPVLTRDIPFRDIRALSGRLLRREPSECLAIRAQDLCHHIHKVLTQKSKENAKKLKAGSSDPKCKASYQIHHGAKVLDVADISWGIACYCSSGQQVAGDMLVGADGVESVVRDFIQKSNANARDQLCVWLAAASHRCL